jgi:ribosomal protein S18 acetylase RimI-like enzyme
MQSYKLRNATEHDSQFIYDLSALTMRGYVEEIWGWDEKWQSERFRGDFQPERWRIVVVDNVNAGAYETISHEAELYLSRIYIAPEFQRRGIGTAIVQTLAALAHSSGLPLKLDVLRNNTNAKRLYERLGLKICGESTEKFFMIFCV